MEFDPEAIAGRVEAFARAKSFLPPGPLVLAVSGGQDSLCMLDILHRLASELGLELRVAHLDHMFRGAESEADARYIADLCARLSLPAIVASIDVPAYAARFRLSNEVAARYARYQFLAAVAQSSGAGRIAVAHTADDSVETLLMNLLRGAGLAGLKGIAPERRLAPGQLGPPLPESAWQGEPLPRPVAPLPLVVRPLLPLSRAETEEYCRAVGLDFRTDPSNADLSYRRNWIRGELMPLVEGRFPGARDRLADAAELLAEDYQLMAEVVDQAWQRAVLEGEKPLEFDLAEWSLLSPALRRHLLRRALERISGSLEGVGRVHLDAAVQGMDRAAVGARIEMPGRVTLEKGYDSFRALPSSAPTEPFPPSAPHPLRVPGTTKLPEGWIEAELLDLETGRRREEYCRDEAWEACLDADRAGKELVVRFRRRGDRFVPLGMSKAKKLHDFMVDSRIPRGQRDRVPLVASAGEILWVAGYRMDDRFKVTPATRRVLRLRLRTGRSEDEII